VDWAEVRCPIVPGSAKHFNVNTAAWYEYITGANPAFPVRALEANVELIEQQLCRMRSTDGDPHRFDSIHHIEEYTEAPDLQIDGYAIHIWQEFNPVYFESLVQLMWGAPMHISHGGLQHATVRYYDAESRRPELPDATAALVHAIGRDFVELELVNLDLAAGRTVVVQAGSFDEHQFVEASVNGCDLVAVDSRWLEVMLGPGAGGRAHPHQDGSLRELSQL